MSPFTAREVELEHRKDQHSDITLRRTHQQQFSLLGDQEISAATFTGLNAMKKKGLRGDRVIYAEMS